MKVPNNKPYLFFDADDTLWENERYFREAEHEFARLLLPYAPEEESRKILAEKQEENIVLFGYGSKTYLIGMADAAAEICGKSFGPEIYSSINGIIRRLAHHEFHIIEGVEEVLAELSKKYRLAVATKGDLREQMDKYRASGLAKYFHHIEVMENKDEENYRLMAEKLDILPEEIIMTGNSVKSDIAPVINIGGRAIHIPHEVTWVHEIMEMPESDRIAELESIRMLPKFIDGFAGLAQNLQ